ncbi:MAG TPA: aminotransferase [Bacillota bacterium]|nr:aminotransferase [Bacillota bacterium]
MNIKRFKIEEWMNEYEDDAVYNLAETCVDSMTVRELITIDGTDPNDFFTTLGEKRLTYGHIEGSPDFRKLVSQRYDSLTAANVLTMNGAIGANFLVLYSLIEPGDEVVCVHPTYQQLYSVPESFGATVKLLNLRPENDYLPDLDELEALMSDRTKMIIINNPNNPTGSLMGENMLREIASIANQFDAYVFSDEVYRGLVQNPEQHIPSIVDIYEKGISTGSMSKSLSLAGLRLGWIAASKTIIEKCLKRRDYTTISCGMIDDLLAVHALKNYDRLMERNINIVQKNLSILDEWIKGEPKISYVKPHAGTTAILAFDYPMSSVEFCQKLYHKNGAFLAPGSCFDLEGTVRIGYACDTDVLKTGLAKISEYLRALEQ